MAYSARKLSKHTKRKLIFTFVFIIFILYATLNWLLPGFIDGISIAKNIIKPERIKKVENITDQTILAPPRLAILYEATNSARIDFKGYAESGTEVKIYLDDDLKETVKTDDGGNFEVLGFDLVLGTNNIYAKTAAKNQESLPSKTIQVIYDNQKPKLSVSSPVDDITIIEGDKKVKVSGKSETNASVFVNGNRVVLDSEGNFNLEVPINEGENNIVVKTSDKATNTTEINRKVTYKTSQETQ